MAALIENHGPGGISVRLIAHSVFFQGDKSGNEIATFELVYPRFIHSELMTHRLFSRNAASSRAIPVRKIIEQVRSNPAMPVHWGKNQPGMQAHNELMGQDRIEAKRLWLKAAENAATVAEQLDAFGAHKQIVNRILEPFQFMKTVVTATELANWFWLRDHEDAQPEIREVARCMSNVLLESMPEVLKPGEWHTPYVSHMNDDMGNLTYYVDHDGETVTLDLQDALRVSSSCCAQVSFRLLDGSLEKAKRIFEMLVTSEPVHASPFEHQATPMATNGIDLTDIEAFDIHNMATHIDTDGNVWSGNFKGWLQHRQAIPRNAKW